MIARDYSKLYGFLSTRHPEHFPMRGNIEEKLDNGVVKCMFGKWYRDINDTYRFYLGGERKDKELRFVMSRGCTLTEKFDQYRFMFPDDFGCRPEVSERSAKEWTKRIHGNIDGHAVTLSEDSIDFGASPTMTPEKFSADINARRAALRKWKSEFGFGGLTK